KELHKHYVYNKHACSSVDYIDHYKEVITTHGIECEVIISNNHRSILDYTKNILTCDIHARKRTKNVLKLHGGEKVYSLADILAEPIDNSGYNEDYGLLGSNKSTDT